MGDEDFDAHLDRVLIGGREKHPVVLAEPDPDWPRRFLAERERIRAALGPRALRIDHVGSTAVPDLPAKPVIDVSVVVADVSDEAAYVPDLENVGYELRVREDGHRMLRTPGPGVHIHVHSVGDPEVRRMLLFRDHLRRSPDDRRAYAELKRELAQRDWDDMNHYAQAKGGLVAEILERAEAWAEDSGWTP